MGTAGDSGSQQIYRGFPGIGDKLWFYDTTGRQVNMGIRVLFSHHKVCNDHSGYHSRGHSPFLKAGGSIKAGSFRGIWPDIGNMVQRHTILGSPVIFFFCFWKLLLGKFSKLLPVSTFFSGSMGAADYKKEILIISEGETGPGIVCIHAVIIGSIGKCNGIGTMLV